MEYKRKIEQAAQIIIDNIFCYQNAIRQIEDKIALVSFIGSVNKSFIPEDLLNINDLRQEKKQLEKNLRLLKMSSEVL